MNYEDLIKTRLNSIYGIQSCCKNATRNAAS